MAFKVRFTGQPQPQDYGDDDGFEFLEEKRRKAEWRDIPVVVVTAKELTDADRLRLNGGVERIILKTNRDDMLHEVRGVLTKCVARQRNAMPAGT